MPTPQKEKEQPDLIIETEALRRQVHTLENRVAEMKKKEAMWLGKSVVLQNIIESPSTVSIVITDLEGNILLWNKGAENMLGYLAGEVVGKQKISMVYPEDGETRETVQDVVKKIIARRKSATFEVEEVHKDGHHLWVRLTVSPRFDEHGNVVGVLGVGENATERKAAEQALAERVTLAAFSAQIGSALVESPSSQPILERCVNIMSQYLKASLVNIWLTYTVEDTLEVQASLGKKILKSRPRTRLRLNEGPAGKVIFSKKAFHTNNPPSHSMLEDEKAFVAGEKIAAYAAYPLMLDQKIFGLVELYFPNPISDATHHSLAAAAHEIALGIDRVRAFDALQTSEERIRSIVNNSLEGIITFFRTGAIASFNPAAETIFGFKAQEIMEQNIHQVLPDLFDAGGKVKPDLISGPHSLLGQLTETTGRHADGHPFPVDLALSELQIPERRKNPRTEIGRRPTLYIGMVRDITERKQFEEALRNERDHTAQIIERTPALVVSMTLDGTTRSVNPAVERTTGYTPAQLIGKNWWRTLFPGHQYRQVEQLFQDMKEEPVRNRELVMTIRSGEQRVVAWSTIQRFDERGTLVENIGFGTDITVQKQVEKELIRAARKAEESNRLKSDFLSIISHELRTPLTVMIGSTPLLMDENDLPESKELVNIVRDIDTSGKHLLALIDDLLDFSKIEAGKMDLVKELFSIREFMDGLIPACQMIAQNKNLTIQTEVEDIKVWADKVRLKQIIFNLLSNAIKFTDQGKIHVRVRPEAGNAVFEVEDTGCGIAEDDLEVIFEAFRQVDASTTREASGTGLGLAITRRLVKLHGGIITVSSHAGQGSQFRFTIPLKNTGDF